MQGNYSQGKLSKRLANSSANADVSNGYLEAVEYTRQRLQ
jgi:hypothetical protein